MSQILTEITSVSKAIRNYKYVDGALMLSVESALKETTAEVYEVLKNLIEKYAPKEYWNIIKYSIRNKEYFERAYYIRLSYENFKSDWKSILPVLAAVELKYAELVIIDDVFDGNSLRMNNPSVPLKLGANKAIVIGCMIKSIATEILADFLLTNDSVNKSVALNIISKDEYSHQKIYEGQYDDIETEAVDINVLTQDFYFDMVRKTTGEDVGYCFEVGALLSGSDSHESSALYEFGVGLGTAMQIRDDTIDFIDNSLIINKSPYSDLEKKKKRLPLLLAYRKADPIQKDKLLCILEKDNLSIEEKHYVSQLVSDESVLYYIDTVIQSIKNKALQDLSRVNKSKQFIGIIEELFNNIILIS
jgi:geranylgeranyl pyrophosphate synthase